MEAVGARLGRSSSRYGPGPATVFSGPVRKWKKKWVSVTAPSTNTNGTANNNASHLVLYKWTQVDSAAAGDKDPAATPATPEGPPRRKFRYVPVFLLQSIFVILEIFSPYLLNYSFLFQSWIQVCCSSGRRPEVAEEAGMTALGVGVELLEVYVFSEKNQDAAAKSDDEGKPSDTDPSANPMQIDDSEGKPDINDITMEEAQASEKKQEPTDEASEANIDLNLGLKGRDGDAGIDSKSAEQTESTGEVGEVRAALNSEAENKRKRKDMAPDLEMKM